MSTSNAQAASKAYSAFIPEIWSTKLQKLLHNSGAMMKCVNKDYEGEIKNGGDTVKIRSFSAVSVSTYTGTIESYSELTPTLQEMIIDQEKEFHFAVNDIGKAQSDINIMSGYLEEAKISVDLAKDTFLLGKHADVLTANTVGTVTAPITLSKDTIYAQFVELAKRLKNANAIETGKKAPWVIINPTIEAILIQAPEFIHATNAGDTVLREGSIGKIAGLDVLVSTNLVAVSSKYYVLAGTNAAITYADQVVKVETLRDQSSFRDLVRGLYVYGAKTVKPACLAKVIFAA